MAFSESWIETDPDGAVITGSLLDDYQRQAKRALRERMEGDPATPNSGIYESGTFAGTAIVRAGTARAYAVAEAAISGLTLQDGRLAITTDTRKVFHLKATGAVEIAYMSSSGGVITGPILAADGTAGAPSYAFSGDPDCGLYRNGTNNLGMSIAGSRVVEFAAGGISVTGTISSTGTITAASNVIVTGGSVVAGSMWRNATSGLILNAVTGSVSDFILTNPAGNSIFQVPTGTQSVQFASGITVANGVTVSAGTTAVQALTATTGTFTGLVTANGNDIHIKNGRVLRVYQTGDANWGDMSFTVGDGFRFGDRAFIGGALVINGALSGITTIAVSSNATIGGTLGVTGILNGSTAFLSTAGSGVTEVLRIKTTGTGDTHPALYFEGSRGGVVHEAIIRVDSGTGNGSEMAFSVDDGSGTLTRIYQIQNTGVIVTGTVTAGTYNGQTIGSAASFTGTMAVATSYSLGGVTLATFTSTNNEFYDRAGRIALYLGGSNSTNFYDNTTHTFRTQAGAAVLASLTTGGLALFGGTIIKANTSDGSDNSYIGLAGGGADGVSRGATIYLSGNERTGADAGDLILMAGNVANGDIRLRTGNEVDRYVINNSGDHTVTGAVSMSSTLGVTGAVTLSSTLALTSSSGSPVSFNSTHANGGYIGIARSGSTKGYLGSAAQLNSGGTNNDFEVRAENILYLTAGATGYVKLDNGALTVSGATIAFSGIGQTTGRQEGRMANTGASLLWGIESSAGGSLFIGGSAYAASFGNVENRPVDIASNNTVRLHVTAAGQVKVIIATQATTTTDGALQVAGGISVVKSVYVGEAITAVGAINATGNLLHSGSNFGVFGASSTQQSWNLVNDWSVDGPNLKSVLQAYGIVS